MFFLWRFASTDQRGLWKYDKKTGAKISELISQGFKNLWHSFKSKDFDLYLLHSYQNQCNFLSWIVLNVGQQEFPWRDIQVLLITDLTYIHNLSLWTFFLYFILLYSGSCFKAKCLLWSHCLWHVHIWFTLTGFWLVWTLIIMLSCCCAYRHRRVKMRLQQEQRQREISLMAYQGASSSFISPPPLNPSEYILAFGLVTVFFLLLLCWCDT